MRKVYMLILLTVVIPAGFLRGQEVTLTLQQALDSTYKNNKDLIIATLDEDIATAQYKQTQAVFLPQIRLSYTALTTNNPLNAFGFKLQQESISASDFNPDLLNNPDATQNFLTKAEWQQPLLNLDMFAMRQAAQAQQDVYTYKTKRTREYLAFEVQKAYAQIQLAEQATQVLEEAYATVTSIYKSANSRYEKGYLQKSDILLIQVQVNSTETKLAEAKSNQQNASDYLGLLMGKAPGVVYRVEPAAAAPASPGVFESTVPDNRADFLALQSAVTAQDRMVQSGKMSYVPKLNAFAEYLINDKDAFGFGADSYLAGAQLSWTIFNGTATRNKVAEQKIARNKTAEQLASQKQQAQLELNKTMRQFNDSRFALEQHKIAVEQSSEALRILQNRHEQGLVSTNDLLQSQTNVSLQKLNQAQAVFQYNITAAYLQFLTSTIEK